jgi:hypothetical protein
MLVCWRDDGLLTLLWLRCSLPWTRGDVSSLPGRGFVGQESPSFRVSERGHARLKSIRLTRIRSTPGAPPWRLTLRWEALPDYRPQQSKTGLGLVG